MGSTLFQLVGNPCNAHKNLNKYSYKKKFNKY